MVGFLPRLGAIWVPDRRTFHDEIVGTLVVRKVDVPV